MQAQPDPSHNPHQNPNANPHAAGIPGPVPPGIDHARDCREFITLNKSAVLSTNSKAQQGFPFGSITPYDVDPNGDVIIYVSKLAVHYKNLMADPRASIFVADPAGLKLPQAYSRATVLVTFSEVPPAEVPAIQQSYFQRFPEAAAYPHDFVLMRGEIQTVRWISGFGQMGWVDAQRFSQVSFDPVAYEGMGMLEHMNEFHKDALRDYLKGLKGIDAPQSAQVKMTSINRRGFTIAIEQGTQKDAEEFTFATPLTDPAEVRKVMIDLLKDARAKKP